MATLSNNKAPAEARGTLGATTGTVSRSQGDRVSPHGGTLISRLVSNDEAADLLLRAAWLPRVVLDARAAFDAEMIAIGAYSPLDGFLRHDDYISVIRDTHLVSGTSFPIPITVSVPRERRAEYAEGHEVALTDASGLPVGALVIDDIYERDRDAEANAIFGTTDRAHPGVAALFERSGDVALGGRITLARRIDPTLKRFRDPSEVRSLLVAANGELASVHVPSAFPRDILSARLAMLDAIVHRNFGVARPHAGGN